MPPSSFYRFFHLPTDRSDVYLYLQDAATGEYWCPTYEPAQTRPDDPLTNYNPGTGENGAVFCHANTWAIIAECLLGRGERAFKYYRQLIPSVAMDKTGVWRYKAEPHVYAPNLFGPQSDKPGLATSHG